MKVDHHKAWSPNLDQEMELNVYGEAGKPVLVFPTRGGRYYDYEVFGMVEACRPFIDKCGIRLFAADSVDFQRARDASGTAAGDGPDFDTRMSMFGSVGSRKGDLSLTAGRAPAGWRPA